MIVLSVSPPCIVYDRGAMHKLLLLSLKLPLLVSCWSGPRRWANVCAAPRCPSTSSRRRMVPAAKLSPLLRTPAADMLVRWQSGAPGDTRYADGLIGSIEWIKSELGDVPYGGMTEDEQREIDSWAFSVTQERRVGPGEPPYEEEGCILCGELVTQIGAGYGNDSRFYWPTVRLVHLTLRPVAGLAEAGPWVLRAAEDAIAFCDLNHLRLCICCNYILPTSHLTEHFRAIRLDYSYLRLILNTPGSRRGAREFEDQNEHEVFFSDDGSDSTALSWVEGCVDWGKLFDGLRSRNAYAEDDFIPGAT
jgi:hypothetical protein